jgi:hypothetical protein
MAGRGFIPSGDFQYFALNMELFLVALRGIARDTICGVSRFFILLAGYMASLLVLSGILGHDGSE